MISVTHAIITHDIVVWLTTALGMALTAGTLYIRVILPRSQEHRKHQEKRELENKAESQRMGARWNIIDGMLGVPGMYGEVLPLAIRLQVMESEIAELKARHA